MKREISILLTVVILAALMGCGASENKESVLTVRIVNQSEVNLYSIAASYSFDGETLGSKVCERISSGYELIFLTDELPTERIDSIKLDLYAAEKAGEDYSFCGSASIEHPQAGNIYTLTLSGDSLHGLALRFLNG
ncbi:MAG: hypothetical protein IJ788_07055 [Oscillospiraceae bacterium]|nr:hypothetical protein [Oscillospiraceae bacterium]